jgi:hypothetical protein
VRNYDAFGRKRGEDPLHKMGWRPKTPSAQAPVPVARRQSVGGLGPRERRIGLAVAFLAFLIVIVAAGVAAAILTTG